MSIDLLQERIRKVKTPLVVDFSVGMSELPPHIRAGVPLQEAYGRFCRELLEGLQGNAAGVRFSFDRFALLGDAGLQQLRQLLQMAKNAGYCVLLDGPGISTPWMADWTAEALLGPDGLYDCHALILSPYIGSDGMRPFADFCRSGEKSVFFTVRSPNKSASELQDLLTGSRLVHLAAADVVNRHGQAVLGRCGYSEFGALASATAPAVLANLRKKYNRMFLLVDGCDYPGGNVKNCVSAFDRFGHGAAISAGPSVVAAWSAAETDGTDYVEQARQAALRLKSNVSRYLTIL